jgi:hypothetical protein
MPFAPSSRCRVLKPFKFNNLCLQNPFLLRMSSPYFSGRVSPHHRSSVSLTCFFNSWTSPSCGTNSASRRCGRETTRCELLFILRALPCLVLSRLCLSPLTDVVPGACRTSAVRVLGLVSPRNLHSHTLPLPGFRIACQCAILDEIADTVCFNLRSLRPPTSAPRTSRGCPSSISSRATWRSSRRCSTSPR